jgi:hypothetical protein
MEPGVPARDASPGLADVQGLPAHHAALGPFTRLGGRVGSANVAFDDHPPDKRFSDRIETVTVDSVFAWLQRAGLGGAPVTLH